MFLRRSLTTMDFLTTLLVATVILETNAGKYTGKAQMDETFYLPQSMHMKHMDRILSYNDRRDDVISPWSESSGKALKPPRFNATFNTCPWTYTIVYNPNRIPSTILEANCSTQQCGVPHSTTEKGPSFDQSKRRASQLHKTMPPPHFCQEVKYYRWVKVKNGKKLPGQPRRSKRLLPVTVACSCVSINQIEADTVLDVL